MSKIIAIANQKGGEGKTTTAINLSCSLARKGKKTLLIDLDPQGNSTGIFFNPTELKLSMIDIFNQNSKIDAVLKKTKVKNLSVLPSLISLAEFETANSDLDAPYILRDAIQASKSKFDYIIIDCPPSLSIYTINAFVCAGYVIVPMQAEKFSMDGITGLQGTISKVQNRINPNLVILGALVTRLKQQTVLVKTILPVIEKYFHVFHASISEGVSVGESNLARKSVYDYNPSAKQSQEYESFAQEVLDELEKK